MAGIPGSSTRRIGASTDPFIGRGFDVGTRIGDTVYAGSDTVNRVTPNDPTTAPNAAATAGGDWKADYRTWRTQNPGSSDIGSLAAYLKSKGYNVTQVPHGSGFSADKLYVNGVMKDFGSGLDSGSGQWFDDPFDAEGNATASGSIGDLMAGSIDPSFLTPFDQQFSTPNPAALPGDYTPDAYQGPSAQSLLTPFNAPTAQSLLGDPSYQFRRDQGQGVLENSAAARGVLNSGGTLKDLIDYGQKFASTEYGNVWDRDFNSWNATNASKAGAWDRDFNVFNANQQNKASAFGMNAATRQDAYNRAWSQFLNDKDTWYRNQSEPFDKILRAGQLGLSAASA